MAKNSLTENLFFDESYYDLFYEMREMYIKDINNQYVYYIPISEELTKTDSIYKESKKKIFGRPVKVYCMLENEEPEITSTSIPGIIDTVYKIKVSIAPEMAKAQGLIIKDGDMLYIDENYYIIQNHYFSRNFPAYVLNCIQNKQGEFDIKITEDDVDF